MTSRSNSAQRDIETLLHPYTNLAAHRETGPMVLERGQGVMVWDNKGTPYIEAMSGLWCTSLGYGNRELVEAASEQLGKLAFTHLFGGKSHDPAIELAEKLKSLMPMPVSKIFFTNSGSEANDTQIKLQWYYNNAIGRPEKKKIISRQKAYHGVTVASASLTGLPIVQNDFDLPIAGILHTDCPHHYRFAEAGESELEFSARLAANLERMILEEGPETVAAFIAEPVMGAGGVLVPPQGYFAAIEAVCRKYDVTMISDEVICGFGRTGKWFGCQSTDFRPDSISFAKALTSGYIPMGGLTVSEDMYQAMLDQSRKLGAFGHGYTYTGHPVAAVTALKTIEIYERDDIPGRAAALAPLFLKRLTALGEHPLVGEARGLGLVGGLELVADKESRRSFDPAHAVGASATRATERHGVIVRAIGDTIAICPPLIISEEEIGALFDAVERGLDDELGRVTREGLARP